jgi:cation diffusion facilitator CzcD-associated flavoprotein CzcO
MTQPPVEELDALVIGAGVTGLYQLYCLRQLGVNARIYEAGEGVGGTWYWNRYPGARLDSESWSYAYSFSEELLQEWEWSESFVGQPELERYLNVVADKFQLRPHIRLGTRVQSAIFDENTSRWDVETEDGHRARAQHVIAAVGLLSATHMPDILGVESFEGESFHTSRWPHEPVDFAGKRVGVIGTGSTGVQVIPEVARECAHLTVFQRTPNYCVPLRNSPIDEEWQREIKANYHEVFERCRNNIGGFIHDPDPRSTFDVTPEEREAFYEDIWAQPGFAKWFGNFSDLMLDRDANELYCEFVRNKIRERVNDPEVAEKLCPKDHHFGAKRIPLETNYYETYNRGNVRLVDVREDPIDRITPTGLRTMNAAYDLDVLIYATGFDAFTGEVTRMDIRGVGGQTIQDRWARGPSMYMGLQTAGFPNLFFENGALFCNFTRCAEATAEFVSGCIGYMRDNGFERIEASPRAEAEWIQQAQSLSANRLTSDVRNWADGSNIPGKPVVLVFYGGGFNAFRELCDEVAAKGYEGFDLK